MEAAHAVDGAAAPRGEIRLVEWFVAVGGIVPAERQEIAQRDAEAFLGVVPEEALDEGRREAVEARRDRGVRGEDVACAGGRQRGVEGTPAVLHETAGALQHGEGRVPFVEMADLGLEPERSQQPPAPDSQQKLLLPPEICAA